MCGRPHHAVLHEHAGDVRPADRAARQRLHLLDLDGDAHALQVLDDADHPLHARPAHVLQHLPHDGVVRRHAVAQQVDLQRHARADLHARQDPHPGARARAQGLRHAVHGVVIRHGQQGEAPLRAQAHHLLGRQRPI